MGIGAGAAAGIAAAAVAVSAYSAVASGEAAKANSDYQAQVAKNNAIIANQNSDYAKKAGEAQAENEQRKGAELTARIEATQAANGIDVNTGSAVDVRGSQDEVNALNTENVRQNALLQAYGYRTQAVNSTAQAGLDQAEGNQAETEGFLKAGSSILSGASGISTKWGGDSSFDFNNQTADNNYGDGLNAAGVSY